MVPRRKGLSSPLSLDSSPAVGSCSTTLMNSDEPHQSPAQSSSQIFYAAAPGGEAPTQTCFYFSVFFSNSAPIFHSNRIPADDLSRADSSTETDITSRDACTSARFTTPREDLPRSVRGATYVDAPSLSSSTTPAPHVGYVRQRGSSTGSAEDVAAVVGDYRCAFGAMEAVAQQTVQDVAFPLVFGRSGGGRHSVLPPRASTSAGAPVHGGGPPWNMRVDEVRSAEGDLRYHRIILTASFAVVVTTHIREKAEREALSAATALVLHCPPDGHHYRVLLHHVDVLRSVLNRTLEFAMRTVQRYFELMYSPTRRLSHSRASTSKEISLALERHSEARETYFFVKAELTSALSLRLSLPVLNSVSAMWAVPVLMCYACSPACARAGMAGQPFLANPQSSDPLIKAESRRREGSRRCRARDAGFSEVLPLSQRVPPLSFVVHDAVSFLLKYSEVFTSAFVCGLLSLMEAGTGGADWRNRERKTGGSTTASRSAVDGAAATTLGSPNIMNISSLHGDSHVFCSPTAAREDSQVFCGSGRAAATVAAAPAATAAPDVGSPEWLSPYDAFWKSLKTTCEPMHGGAGPVDRIDFGKSPVIEATHAGDQATDEVHHPLTDASSSCCLRSPAPELLPLDKAPQVDCPEVPFLRASSGTATQSPTPPFGSPTAMAAPVSVIHRTSSSHLLATAGLSDDKGVAFTPATGITAGLRAKREASSDCGASSVAGEPQASAAAKEKENPLLARGRLGRVLIFTRDGFLAWRLLVTAAFVWNNGGGTSRAAAAGAALGSAAARLERGNVGTQPWAGHRSEEEKAEVPMRRMHEVEAHMCETAVAAAAASAEFANVPIQWVTEEYSPASLSRWCSRFSPENTLLVVAPRQLLCQRVCLRKYVAGTTVLVERTSAGARTLSAPFPFRCTITRKVEVQPHPTATTLLREACALHESSQGTVDFTGVFRRMISLLFWQSAATVLAQGAHTKASLHPSRANSTTMGLGGPSLTPYASADAVSALFASGRDGAAAAAAETAVATAGGETDSRDHHPMTATPAIGVTQRRTTPVLTPLGNPNIPWEREVVGGVLLPGSMGAAVSLGGCSHGYPSGSGAGGAAPGPPSRAESVSATSQLLISHGLLQPPTAFTTASPTIVTPTGKAGPSFKFMSWLRPSPTSTSSVAGTGAACSHPTLSPTTLGQMFSTDGGVGGQLPRLLVDDDDDDDDVEVDDVFVDSNTAAHC